MGVYFKLNGQQIADALEAIGWQSGSGGDATLAYGTEPTSPINGTLWFDSSESILRIYAGGIWLNVNISQEDLLSIQTSVGDAQSAATDAQNALGQFQDITATASTGDAGTQAIASFDPSTGVMSFTIPKGDQGQGLSPKGTDTSTNILAKAGTDGDFWIASDTGDGYVYDGTSWVNTGAIRGPQGLQGEQGIQGIQGIQGETGNGIASITRTSGDGSAGTTDTYTITYTDATTSTFQVYNGADGETYDDTYVGKVNQANSWTLPQRTSWVKKTTGVFTLSEAQNFEFEPTADMTINLPSDLSSSKGQQGLITIATGTHTISWASGWYFPDGEAPTLPENAYLYAPYSAGNDDPAVGIVVGRFIQIGQVV